MKIYFWVGVFILFSFGSFFFYFHMTHRTRRAETFLNYIDKTVFWDKAKKKMPDWAEEQIAYDLQDFSNTKISFAALEKTYFRIREQAPGQKGCFNRYCIIDNKLYRYFPKGEIDLTENRNEKALKTLTQLIKLPDVDFILSDMDGTPEVYMKNDFYITTAREDQAPILTRAKLQSAKYLLLIPDNFSISPAWKQMIESILSKKNSWNGKIAKAFWRGVSSDKSYTLENYRERPRYILSKISQNAPEYIDAGLVMCEYAQLIELLQKEDVVKGYADISAQLQYRYLPVLDGWMCTYPGFQWRLMSGSLCFKQQSEEKQWFYRGLKPYAHYIPIENDMSDIIEKVIWARENDMLCQEMVKRASAFALENLMYEDIYVYFYHVLKRYEEHQNFTKQDMIKNVKEDSRWICIQRRQDANRKLKRESDVNI